MVIFQSFWSQGLFTLLNYWGLQRASVSAGYIYWYLSYDRDQQTLAYGPNLAHDCFFVKKKLVEHSQVHLFMYCLWFFRASLVVQMVKNLETWVWSLGWEDSRGGGHSNPLQYSCLENPHGQRSLAGYSGSDTTEQLSTAHNSCPSLRPPNFFWIVYVLIPTPQGGIIYQTASRLHC